MRRSAVHATSVADLIRAGHVVMWDCEVCGRRGPVDLLAIERVCGPNFTLANRRPRCRHAGCPGRVRFRLAMGLWHRELDTIEESDPAWWDYSDQRRAELLALGWRIVMGKWVAPVEGPQ